MKAKLSKQTVLCIIAFLGAANYLPAQNNQLRLMAGANALSWDCLQTNWMVNYECTFKYNLGLGLQAGFHSGIKPEHIASFSTDYNIYKHQWTTDIYGNWKPINTNHVVSLGIGYAFTLFTSNELQPNNMNDYALRRQVDHGILGRVSYEYVFNNGFTLGTFCQYTNYLVSPATQDQLMFGITIGFRF